MRKRSIFSVGQVLFIVIFLRKAESQVTITPHFSSPVRVLEGQPLTLEWTYSIQGSLFQRLEFGISGAAVHIVEAFYTGNLLILDDRVSVNITATNGTITFRTTDRNDSNDYTLVVFTFGNNSGTSDVKIIVDFKAEIVGFVTNATTVCQNDVVSFNCSAIGYPAVHTYLLYVNGVMNDRNSLGAWRRTMTSGGEINFTCVANNTLGTDSRTIPVNVNGSSSIQTISDKVVREGSNVTLFCNASGIPEPVVSWINVRNDQRTHGRVLAFENITRYQAGEYRCEASNPCRNATESATIDVHFEPEIIQLVPSETTTCLGDSITFNCSANSNPAVHTYRLYVNGIMVNETSTTGVWNRIMTTRGEFVYNCMVNNSVGTAMSTNVTITINVPSVIQPIDNEVIIEGGNVTLTCNASGFPTPTVFWVKTSNGQRTNWTELVFTNISRDQAGEYRCEATNLCNTATDLATVNVLFEPEMVQLVPSETTACLGDSITFNCSANSNPAVHTNQLYLNGMMVNDTSTTGVWKRTMTTRGEFVYKCMVNNTVGTAMSTNVTITVNVPSFIQPIEDEMIIEGGNVNLTCNASGFPTPTVSWVKTSNGQLTNGTELVLTSISRDQAGEYRCEASNLCNTATELATVDVQFKPEMVVLDPSVTTVCRGDIIVFNCSAYSNPQVHTYELYVNGTMVNEISRMGIWNITMATGGVFVYKCMVNNTIGTAMSMNVSVTVNEPSSIDPFTNKKIIEGENLTIMCEATGTLPLTVSWVNTSDGERTNGTKLVFTYIDRTEAGEYRCEASNLCGNDSESVEIDVLFKPEMVQLFASKATVCSGSSVILNCSAYGNPVVHTYQLYESGTMVEQISSTGVWTRTLSTGGEFVFKCMVNNTVGTAMSPNVSVFVNEPSSINPFTKKNIIEEEDLTIMCVATGTPPPNVSWVKTSDGERTNGTELVFTYIDRTEAGEYRCEASNLCGNASESVEIDVFFKPEMVQLFASEETVNSSASITFNCSAYSNPMVHAYHLYENEIMVEEISSTGVWTRTMSTGGEFVFKCMVNNTVGTAMSANVSVTVKEKCEPDCTGEKVCLALGTKHFCSCPYGKTGERCEQNDTLVTVVEVGFEFTNEEFKSEYEDLEDPITDVLIQKIKQAIQTEMTGTGLRDVLVKKLRSGSVIADIELIFNSSVAKDAIEGLLKESLEDSKLGNLDVGQFKFDGVIPEPEQKEECSQFFEGPDCKQATGALIALIVVAVVVVVALLIAIVACSLQKKNSTGQGSVQNGKYSQRQDPEGRHGTVGKEGNVYGGVTSGRNGHGSVNTGFEDETPMVTLNSNNAQTPGITLNDSRSQKARPGEGTYADLGDFQQTPSSSTTVTTGPLKRGPKYEETPYAEITQFLQGPVEPEKEESPVEVPVNLEGPLEEPEDDVKGDALNNLNDDARDQSNEQTNADKLYPSLKEVDGGNKPAQFEVSI